MKKKSIALKALFLLVAYLGYSNIYAQNVKTKADTVSKYERANAEFLMIDAQKFFLLEDFERAKAFLQQSLETDSKNHAAHFKLAEIHLIERDYAKGTKAIKKAQELSPGNKYYYILAAQLNKAQNNLQAAAQEYEAMIANTTDYREYLLDLVDVYVALEEYDKAISTLQTTENQFNTPHKFYIQKKELLMQMGKEAEALALLETLTNQYPNNEDYKIQYANLLAETGQKTEAARILESTEQIEASTTLLIDVKLGEQNYAEAQTMINSLFKSGQVEPKTKADLLQKLVSSNLDDFELGFFTQLQQELSNQYPNNIDVIKTSEIVYSRLLPTAPTHYRDDYEKKVLEALISLKDLNPSDYEVWNQLMTRAYQQQSWNELMAIGEDALSYFPNQGIFYFYYGAAQLYASSGDKEEANFAFNQALKLSRSDIELTGRVKALQAELSIETGEPEAARENIENSFIDSSPTKEFNETLVKFVVYHNDVKVSTEVLKNVDTLMKKYPSSTELIETKARILFQMGSFAEARKTVEKFLSADSSNIDGSSLEFYGDILIKLDLTEEAIEQWQKAKKLGNTSDKIDQKIADKKYYE